MAKDVILEADLGGTPLTGEELAAIPDFAGIRKEIWGKFPGAIAKKTFRRGEILIHSTAATSTGSISIMRETKFIDYWTI